MSDSPPSKRLRSAKKTLEANPVTTAIDECDESGDEISSDVDIIDEAPGVDELEECRENDIEVTYEAAEPETQNPAPPPSASENVKLSVNATAGTFILSLHEKCLASQSDRQELLQDAKLLAKDCMKTLVGKIDEALKAKGSAVKVCDLMNVNKSISSTCYDTFKNLNSKSQQEKYFAETLGVTEVRRIPLGRIMIRGRKGTTMKTKIIEQELMYVPIEETIDKLINHPDYKSIVEDRSCGTSNSKILDSYMKGELSKINKVLQKHPDALRFLLYYDDVEVCSPLKSRAGKQKVGAFYLILDNILPKFRSNLKAITLVALVNCNFIKGKQYGMDSALEIIVDELKKFETGITLKSGIKVYGTVIATIGDNLGQHALGGFKEGFTAHRPCRYCNATFNTGIKTLTKEDVSLLRSKEEYEKQIEKIQTVRGKNEKASTEFGLNRESYLNQLESFHVLDNMPPDLLHDCLEGALSLTVKRLLRYYLYEKKDEKPFTLTWLNARIKHFDFDYSEMNDKPSELKEDYIRDISSTSLHQSASQLWLLATVLPIILEPHIDSDEEHWENFLNMLEVSRIVFTQDFPLWMVNYLQHVTELYLSGFITLYGALIPKQHFLIHYPRLILQLGSLVNYMCMRCEANHKYYKRLISVITAYKNIPLFLARRDQLHQSYSWMKSLKSETTCGPHFNVTLKFALYGDLIHTSSGEVKETSWLKMNGIKFKPDQCYIVVGVEDCLPIFALIKNVIVYPEVAFICQKVKVTYRNVLAACFIVTLRNEYCVYKPQDMLEHAVYHAHFYCGNMAIAARHCIGGQA